MARTHGHGNPKWTPDETLLALDLYFECHGNIPSPRDPRVQRLSKLLQQMPYHWGARRNEAFRNPDSVTFKLQNLRKVATGKGLGNVSETDRQVWAEFSSQPETVKHLAALIRAGLRDSESIREIVDDDEDVEFVEGRLLTWLHRKRERHPALRRRLIASRRRTGRLVCDMCGRGPGSADPQYEDACFEAHHLVPISTGERTTRLADTALLCANCHRLIHRAIALQKRWLCLEEGKLIVAPLEVTT